MDEDELDRAEALCRGALEHLARQPSSSLHFETLLQLGMVLETADRRDEALAVYRQARDRVEHLRSHLQTDDLKFGFFRNKLRVYEALVALTLQTAWRIERHGWREAREEISAIKFLVADVMLEVVDRALQVHGGLGMTDDTIISFFYRHERAARIYDGADEVHKVSVSKRILREYEGKVVK